MTNSMGQTSSNISETVTKRRDAKRYPNFRAKFVNNRKMTPSAMPNGSSDDSQSVDNSTTDTESVDSADVIDTSTVARKMYRGWDDFDLNPHSNILDQRLTQHSFGLQGDLVKLTHLHVAVRARSKRCLAEDECILWYRTLSGAKQTFDEIAFGYKATYFQDMSAEIDKMTVGSRMYEVTRHTTRDRWNSQTHFSAWAPYVKRCALAFHFAGERGLKDEGMSSYLRQKMLGKEPSEVMVSSGFFDETPVDAAPYAEEFQRMSTALSGMDEGERKKLEETCLQEYYKNHRKTQSDIFLLLSSILHCPLYPRTLTLWRYLSTASGTVEHNFTQVGEIVTVERFMSTGTSPMTRSTYAVLLKIELPPNFPFWMLSGGIEQIDIEHREVVLPYTLDATGRTLNYGLLIKKVIRKPDLRAEGVKLSPAYLVIVTPSMLPKPVKLFGFHPIQFDKCKVI